MDCLLIVYWLPADCLVVACAHAVAGLGLMGLPRTWPFETPAPVPLSVLPNGLLWLLGDFLFWCLYYPMIAPELSRDC